MTGARIGVIYHEHCSDGACAAWAITHLAAPHAVAAYPAPPSRAPAALGEHDVFFVVDTCLPAAFLAELDARTPLGVWVLDHHVTNRPIVDAHARGVFDLARSGAGLAWDEGARILEALGFRSGRPARPWFVDDIEDRDLWRHARPDTHAVNAALGARERTPAAIEALWRETLATSPEAARARYRAEGEGVLVGVADTVRNAVRTALPFVLEGRRGLAVCSATHASDIGNALVAAGDLAAIWYLSASAGELQVQVSFRSRDDLPDAAALAEALGGGGHRNASGAVVPLARWLAALAPT